jgi:hypothetical protein
MIAPPTLKIVIFHNGIDRGYISKSTGNQTWQPPVYFDDSATLIWFGDFPAIFDDAGGYSSIFHSYAIAITLW